MTAKKTKAPPTKTFHVWQDGDSPLDALPFIAKDEKEAARKWCDANGDGYYGELYITLSAPFLACVEYEPGVPAKPSMFKFT